MKICKEDLIILIALMLGGCATVPPINTNDNQRFEDEFRRNNSIPKMEPPPPVLSRRI